MTTYQTPDPIELRVRLSAGRIEVATWDEPRTEVEIEPDDNSQASRDAVAEVHQELHERAAGARLVVESRSHGGRFGLRRDPHLLFTIRAPHGSSVHATTASADVRCAGRIGSLRAETASGAVGADEATDAAVKTVSGDVRLDRVTGAVRCNSVSGGLTVGAATGDVALNSVSGDAHIGAAAGSVTAKSVSGDVRVDSVARGETSLRSVSGDMTVGVAPGATLWMDVSSVSGDTRSDLDPMDAAAGGGGVDLRIRARSTSGDIRLMRAEAPAPV